MNQTVEEAYNTGLVLRLACGAGSTGHRRWRRRDFSKKSEPSVQNTMLPGPSLTLGFSDSDYSPSLAASLLDVKKEDEEMEKLSQRGSDEEDEGSCRKKLRLSKEQSTLLEEKFREHSTLNPKQKQTLAKQLNLRPRQVEVWFQNRRARTKLKQIEVDCELLRRCCETLREENRRLHRELQELKALKLTAAVTPMYMQLPTAAYTVCPSCERVAAAGARDGRKATSLTASSTAIVNKKALFLNPFSHSATC
ncbi:homeobox-leucine zipper protein HOX19-like [Phalaenopsis equestris]|uniref:homeobox-leucine zipper protein HOX19-like n=1 Tax=Phalaenopsis equestris TaxID=78828 RepID=UPI0009E1F338|nr:homeobox-leucine zipper protein HOX19-like [Phalaenopsis equestris]